MVDLEEDLRGEVGASLLVVRHHRVGWCLDLRTTRLGMQCKASFSAFAYLIHALLTSSIDPNDNLASEESSK